MGLGVWFREEIRNALYAAEEVCRSTVEALGDDSEYTKGYRDGFHAAIVTLATAFGISKVGVFKKHPTPSGRVVEGRWRVTPP